MWVFRPIPFWLRLVYALWPPARRRYEQELLRVLTYLLRHPEIEVRIE